MDDDEIMTTRRTIGLVRQESFLDGVQFERKRILMALRHGKEFLEHGASFYNAPEHLKYWLEGYENAIKEVEDIDTYDA
jgi:hypothetical protein